MVVPCLRKTAHLVNLHDFFDVSLPVVLSQQQNDWFSKSEQQEITVLILFDVGCMQQHALAWDTAYPNKAATMKRFKTRRLKFAFFIIVKYVTIVNQFF